MLAPVDARVRGLGWQVVTPAMHFGIMMVLNLSIGLCTPPVGNILFLSCAVTGTTITRMIRPLIPMYLAMIVALLLVTYVPAISEWLPARLGQTD